MLYLSISKHIPKKKISNPNEKQNLFCRISKVLSSKTQNKKARFLLYRDLRTLKQKSEFFFNKNRRKIFSKPWISKSRRSSWVNFSCIFIDDVFFAIKQQHYFFEKKQKLRFRDFKFPRKVRQRHTKKAKKRQYIVQKKNKKIF